MGAQENELQKLQISQMKSYARRFYRVLSVPEKIEIYFLGFPCIRTFSLELFHKTYYIYSP